MPRIKFPRRRVSVLAVGVLGGLLTSVAVVWLAGGNDASPSSSPEPSSAAMYRAIRTAPATMIAPDKAMFSKVRQAGGNLTEWTTGTRAHYWNNASGTPVLVQMDALRGMADSQPGVLLCTVPSGSTVDEVRGDINGLNGHVIRDASVGAILTINVGPTNHRMALTCMAVVATVSVYDTGEAPVQ